MGTVSVVVPTIGRPELRDAVESIASQSNCSATAVVVLDDPSKEEFVRDLLSDIEHELHVVNRIGAAAARNVGLAEAHGDYIGYLDDDDVWLPNKAALQIAAIRRAAAPARTFSVVASRFVRADGSVSPDEPRSFDPGKESFPNHLVARRNVRFGSVYFNTPALLGPASLMKSVRWDEELRKHQDWDLLIRLWAAAGGNCSIVNRQLVVVQQGSIGSISARKDWRDGEAWLARHNEVVTGRARADFIVIHILQHAFRARSAAGIKRSFSLMSRQAPHLAAVIRCLAGITLRR